ncbi:hypothetical protein [Thermodesulfatator autotrophicus]|uniref:Uncharacterized protein n=1 Tax=Thermodesulfatator autotrophicus TaxID=1795632 RepID=A0A177E6G8_9BACT|nr:hypothetical protein [Thermodesulfatator autotrophicus]OAG27040.1 hypothetical protein TH606_09170 [Thermodesulfatator autotrophicus]
MEELNQEQLDLEILPNEAKKELLEFYQMPLKKYKIKKRGLLPKGFYQPIKVKSYSKIAAREEIYERR